MKHYKMVAKEFVSMLLDEIKDGEDIESQVSDTAAANRFDPDTFMEYVLAEIKRRGIRY